MDAKRQYLQDLGYDLEGVYSRNRDLRMRGIYGTSRHCISMENAGRLWACITPITDVVNSGVPIDADDYGKLTVSAALAVEDELAALNVFGGFGIGQKIANLYMKDQWALGRVVPLELVLHAPLDRLVLRTLRKELGWPRRWSAWTKVRARPNPAVIDEYLEMQDTIRVMAGSKTPLEYEQGIWHEASA